MAGNRLESRASTLSFLGTVGALLAAAGLGLSAGCASTEFIKEGPGQPSDRASGTVPDGALGVCRRPNTNRPSIVNPSLWENTRTCTSRTPDRYVRLGYGVATGVTATGTAAPDLERILAVLREGPKEDTGNNKLTSLLRSLHETGLQSPLLRDRVSRETGRGTPCDYTYLFNTMAREHARLSHNDRCTAQAYDGKLKAEACLFDPSHDEVVWLTSSWDCVTHTGAIGEQESCYRLCGYDDYCAKQVSCAAPDVDLLLCAMGVCLPEPRTGP